MADCKPHYPATFLDLSSISETSEYPDVMEGSNNKKAILVAEISRINEENRNLNSILNQMSTSYNDLQKHIMALVRRKEQVSFVDGSQIFNPDDVREEKSNLRIFSPGPVDVHSGSPVSHHSYASSDCPERICKKEGKKAKLMEDQQLPSKKRKINYIQFDQSQNGMINSSMVDGLTELSLKSYNSSNFSQQVKKEGKNARVMDDQQLPSKKRKINYFQLGQTQTGTTVKSSLDDTLICEEPRKQTHNAPTMLSSRQTVYVPKKIVSFRRRTEASGVIMDAEPLLYLQTRG